MTYFTNFVAGLSKENPFSDSKKGDRHSPKDTETNDSYGISIIQVFEKYMKVTEYTTWKRRVKLTFKVGSQTVAHFAWFLSLQSTKEIVYKNH